MNDETYKERCDEILLSRGKLIKELIDLGYDIKCHRVNGSDKDEIKKNISRIITDARTCIDTKGKTTEEIADTLNNLSLKFQKNEFKKAKSWLLEHKYPLDLIKGIIDFNIVDLANLMFEAENNLYGKETWDLQDKT